MEHSNETELSTQLEIPQTDKEEIPLDKNYEKESDININNYEQKPTFKITNIILPKESIIVISIFVLFVGGYIVTTITGLLVQRICIFSCIEEGFVFLVMFISRALCSHSVQDYVRKAILNIDIAAFGSRAKISRLLRYLTTDIVMWMITGIFVFRFIIRLLFYMVSKILIIETIFEIIVITSASIYFFGWYITNYIQKNYGKYIPAIEDG